MAAQQAVAPVRSGSGDRFYQLDLRHRPAFRGDIGSLIRIQGLLVGGEGALSLLLLPDTPMPKTIDHLVQPTVEEWTDFLQRSDDPEVLIMPAKAFHRKVRYEISGFVQQKVWLADRLKCMYCSKMIGEVQLTIDHFVSLEQGGANDTSNYLTACRKCNKSKGSEDPVDWCKHGTMATYDFYVTYLKTRKV